MLAVACAACGSGPTVTGVQLVGAPTVVAGFPLEVTATVTGTGTFDGAVDFTLVSGSGALKRPKAGSVTFIGSTGTTGSATIKATSRADPTQSASRTVTVTAPEPALLNLAGHWTGELTFPGTSGFEPLIADFTAVDGGYTVATGVSPQDQANCFGPIGSLARGPAVVSGNQIYMDTIAPSGAELEHIGTLTANPDKIAARTVTYGLCAGQDASELFHR
jgi:hypothetical protein